MSDYFCQLKSVDSATIKFKPSHKEQYEAAIKSYLPKNQRTYTKYICNRKFNAEVVGGKGFGVTLICKNEITIKMMKGWPTQKDTPAMHIILHQKSCYEDIQAVYGDIIAWAINEFGIGKIWWGNVDLCVHVEGYDFDLYEDNERINGLFYKKNGYLVIEQDYKKIFTGFTTGTHDSETIYGRIYDKIQKLKRKTKSLDPRPYYKYPSKCLRPWVIEISFREEWLKQQEIFSGVDLWAKLPELWKHGTQKFMVHTISKEDRKTPSDFWNWVSSLWGEGAELQKRIPAPPPTNSEKKIKSFNQIRSKVSELMNELPQHQQELYSRELINHISKVSNTSQVTYHLHNNGDKK